jgi:hypothetical protein
MGVGSAAAAKAKIYIWDTDDTVIAAEAALPRGIVDYQNRRTWTERTGTNTFTGGGTTELKIEYVTAQSTRQAANKECTDYAGVIEKEVWDLVTGGGAYLNVTRIEVQMASRLALPENNANNGYVIIYSIDWTGTHE